MAIWPYASNSILAIFHIGLESSWASLLSIPGENREREERGRMEYEQDEESQSLLYLGKPFLKNIKLKFG